MRSANIVIFLLFLNGAAGLMAASGVAGNIGVQPDPGGDATIEKVNDSTASVGADAEGVQKSFIGNAISAAQTAWDVFSLIYIGPLMIENLGVPGWIVHPFFVVAYAVVALDIISVFAQFRIQS